MSSSSIDYNPRRIFALVLLIAVANFPVNAAEVAAQVQFAKGTVIAISDTGNQRALRKGDEVFSGDTIESGKSSSAQLVFSDESRMAVRADTKVSIQQYHYDAKNKKNSSSIFRLFVGAVRSITGFIGQSNKSNVVVNTPIATVGIRGTDHEIIHITAEAAGDIDPEFVGTYNKVYSGGTVLQSEKGSVELDANQIGFVAGVPGNIGVPEIIDVLPGGIDDRLVWKIPENATNQSMNANPGNFGQMVSASRNQGAQGALARGSAGIAQGIFFNPVSVLPPGLSGTGGPPGLNNGNPGNGNPGLGNPGNGNPGGGNGNGKGPKH